MPKRGIIRKFYQYSGSALGEIVIEDSRDGRLDSLFCDYDQTARALESAYGGVVGEGHTIETDGRHIGREIVYDMGILRFFLEAFTPAEEWDERYPEGAFYWCFKCSFFHKGDFWEGCQEEKYTVVPEGAGHEDIEKLILRELMESPDIAEADPGVLE